jgi:hypothetical protein
LLPWWRLIWFGHSMAANASYTLMVLFVLQKTEWWIKKCQIIIAVIGIIHPFSCTLFLSSWANY